MKREGVIGVIINLILLLLGLILAFTPINGMSAIVSIIGIGILIYGIFMLVSVFISKTKRGTATIALAVILVIAGILLLMFNVATAEILLALIAIIIAVWTLFTGIMNISRALRIRKAGSDSWWLPLAFAILYLALGTVLVVNLTTFSAITAIMLGIFFIIAGILGLVFIGIMRTYLNKYNISGD